MEINFPQLHRQKPELQGLDVTLAYTNAKHKRALRIDCHN